MKLTLLHRSELTYIISAIDIILTEIFDSMQILDGFAECLSNSIADVQDCKEAQSKIVFWAFALIESIVQVRRSFCYSNAWSVTCIFHRLNGAAKH